VTVTIAGLIGMVIALVFGGDQFQSNFLLFLHVLSYYITPWVAVLIVDYYVVQRAGRNIMPFDDYYTPTGAFGRFNAAGLAALIVGVLVSVPFMANDFYTGPIGDALAGADLSYFVSGIVAAVVYLVMRPRFAPQTAAIPDAAARDRASRLQKTD
jgi:nucleobase:cation symporter-1, NCS1 family